MIKYIKSVLWRVAKCLSSIEEARCLKVKGRRGVAGTVNLYQSSIIIIIIIIIINPIIIILLHNTTGRPLSEQMSKFWFVY